MFSVVPYACVLDDMLRKTELRYEIRRSLGHRLKDRVIQVIIPQHHLEGIFHVSSKHDSFIAQSGQTVYRSNNKNFEEFFEFLVRVIK